MKQNAIPLRFTSEDLWTRYFTVKMLFLHSRSVNQIRERGFRISGNPEIDQQLDKQEITTQLNIDAMFEKSRAGVSIKVVNYNDTAIIYQIINSHLIACTEYLTHGINVGNVPLKDLIELDAFAAKIYDKAKCVFSEQEHVSAISTNFQNIQAFNFNTILKRNRAGETATKVTASGVEVHQVTTVDEVPKFPERSSYKDILAGELARVEGWRGKL